MSIKKSDIHFLLFWRLSDQSWLMELCGKTFLFLISVAALSSSVCSHGVTFVKSGAFFFFFMTLKYNHDKEQGLDAGFATFRA